MRCTNPSCQITYPLTLLRELEFSKDQMLCFRCGCALELSADDLLGENNLLGKPSRPLQLEMAQHIERVIRAGKSGDDTTLGIVEGGTGVGKTLAYLAPVAVGNRRVLVSTANKALQNQILNEDGPLLQAAMQRAGEDLKIAVFKGKANYACAELVKAGGKTWPHTSYDIDETPTPPPWTDDVRVSSCLGATCPSVKECAYFDMRTAVQEAQMVVVNHYAVAAEFNIWRRNKKNEDLKDSIFGPRDVVIFDEAHTLHDIFSSALSEELTANTLKRLAAKAPNDELVDLLEEGAKVLSTAFQRLRDDGSCTPGRGNNATLVLTEGAVEELDSVERILGRALTCAKGESSALSSRFNSADNDTITFEDVCAMRRIETRLLSLLSVFEDIHRPAQSCVWIEYRYNNVMRDHEAQIVKRPLNVYHVLKDFWSKTNAILTSATISNSSSDGSREFGKFRRTLGVVDADPRDELVVSSPFNYRRQCVMYLTRDTALLKPKFNASELKLREWYAAMSEEIAYWVSVTRGHAMILCASAQDLKELETRCRTLPEFEDIEVISQQHTANTQLVHTYLSAVGRAKSFGTYGPVMFGLRSIWEGVSIPGTALTNVIIPRIPFSNNTDPVFVRREANLHAYYTEQGIPEGEIKRRLFSDLQLYDTSIQLRQGVGRLIRTPEDKGLIAVLDPRLVTYGMMAPLLAELPMFFPGKNTTDNKARCTSWFTNHLLPSILKDGQ